MVQTLWQQAESNFNEVADIGMKNADGSFVGFWGAMSDETMAFMPWSDDFREDCIWLELKCMKTQ